MRASSTKAGSGLALGLVLGLVLGVYRLGAVLGVSLLHVGLGLG